MSVSNISEARAKARAKAAKKQKEKLTELDPQDFEAIAAANEAKAAKLKKERNQANKSVLRTYKIKG